MAGGPEDDFERARPLFDAMGELIVHVGPHGHGSMVKLINNTLAAVNAAGLAEGLLLAQAAGVDTDRALEVIRAGSGASLMAEIKAAPMLDHDLHPLFKLEHMLKDVRHCIAEARALGIEPTVASTAESLYSQAERKRPRRTGLRGRDRGSSVAKVTKFGLKYAQHSVNNAPSPRRPQHRVIVLWRGPEVLL